MWKYRELLTNTGVYDKLFFGISIVSWKVRVCNSMRVASLMPVLLLPLANVTPVMKMSGDKTGERVISCGMTIPARSATRM